MKPEAAAGAPSGSVLASIRDHERALAARVDQARRDAESAVARAEAEARDLLEKALRDRESAEEAEEETFEKALAAEAEARRALARERAAALTRSSTPRIPSLVETLMAIVLPAEED